MRIEPEISGVTVVLLGDFNPAIFTPAWFALHRLLPESVVTNADLKVAHRQMTSFDADWLNLEVEVERFVASTSLAPYVRLQDLIVRVFKDHLFHTPVRAFGINRKIHFQVRSLAARDQVGRTLAPVEPWGPWGHDLGLNNEHGGMTSLKMSQFNPEGRPSGGQINVTVEPSKRIGEGRFGVYVSVNDHYAIQNAESGTAEQTMRLFDENFETSLGRSEGIIDHVMSLATI